MYGNVCESYHCWTLHRKIFFKPCLLTWPFSDSIDFHSAASWHITSHCIITLKSYCWVSQLTASCMIADLRPWSSNTKWGPTLLEQKWKCFYLRVAATGSGGWTQSLWRVGVWLTQWFFFFPFLPHKSSAQWRSRSCGAWPKLESFAWNTQGRGNHRLWRPCQVKPWRQQLADVCWRRQGQRARALLASCGKTSAKTK